jgi:hypothetical protein
MNCKIIIRKERQEYPNLPVEEAMEEKLSIVYMYQSFTPEKSSISSFSISSSLQSCIGLDGPYLRH